ncbi:hypothetical protein SLS58_002734 [Diplodia intermedia]|uniref:Uncharacterized protein n=1 Tax=Diplodia intermedia TaxID=856260 RepID=A0ABR3TYB8_9PEZI
MSFGKDRRVHDKQEPSVPVSRMESLQLATSGGNASSADSFDRVLRALPNSLISLHLFNALLTAPVLCQVLDAHRHWLVEFGLCRYDLTDESWIPVFRILDIYLPQLRSGSCTHGSATSSSSVCGRLPRRYPASSDFDQHLDYISRDWLQGLGQTWSSPMFFTYKPPIQSNDEGQ